MTSFRNRKRVHLIPTSVNLYSDVTFFRNEIVQFLLSIASFLVLVNFLLISYFIHPSRSLLVLHYNVYFGVDLQGMWWQFYLLPVMGLFFFLIHSSFAYFFYKNRERIATYILLFFSVLLSFGLIIAVASIILINY